MIQCVVLLRLLWNLRALVETRPLAANLALSQLSLTKSCENAKRYLPNNAVALALSFFVNRPFGPQFVIDPDCSLKASSRKADVAACMFAR